MVNHNLELNIEVFNSYMNDFIRKFREAKRVCGHLDSINSEELNQLAQVAFKKTIQDYKEARQLSLEENKLDVKDLSSLSIDELKSKLITAKEVENALLGDINLKTIGNQQLLDKLNEYKKNMDEIRKEKSTFILNTLNKIDENNNLIEEKDNEIKTLKLQIGVGMKAKEKKKNLLSSSFSSLQSKIDFEPVNHFKNQINSFLLTYLWYGIYIVLFALNFFIFLTQNTWKLLFTAIFTINLLVIKNFFLEVSLKNTFIYSASISVALFLTYYLTKLAIFTYKIIKEKFNHNELENELEIKEVEEINNFSKRSFEEIDATEELAL